ncbi:hypothetical protein D3C72_504760 [compost metagenome]
MKGRIQVDVDNSIPFCIRKIFHRRYKLYTGIIDQDVYHAKALEAFGSHIADLRRIGHISRKEQVIDPEFSGNACCDFRTIRLQSVEDNIIPFVGIHSGNSHTYTTGTSGNQYGSFCCA